MPTLCRSQCRGSAESLGENSYIKSLGIPQMQSEECRMIMDRKSATGRKHD